MYYIFTTMHIQSLQVLRGEKEQGELFVERINAGAPTEVVERTSVASALDLTVQRDERIRNSLVERSSTGGSLNEGISDSLVAPALEELREGDITGLEALIFVLARTFGSPEEAMEGLIFRKNGELLSSGEQTGFLTMTELDSALRNTLFLDYRREFGRRKFIVAVVCGSGVRAFPPAWHRRKSQRASKV